MKTTKFSKTGGDQPAAVPSPMSTTTETEARPARAVRAGAKSLVLFAVIKASSKYAYQGRYAGKPAAMRVTATGLRGDDYAFRLENGNDYRREDLTFYVKGLDGKLLKLR
jgi:hypothetical protein